jgi:hypothetical protein
MRINLLICICICMCPTCIDVLQLLPPPSSDPLPPATPVSLLLTNNKKLQAVISAHRPCTGTPHKSGIPVFGLHPRVCSACDLFCQNNLSCSTRFYGFHTPEFHTLCVFHVYIPEISLLGDILWWIKGIWMRMQL